MCLGGSSDGAAHQRRQADRQKADIRQRENQRQRDVRLGRRNVNKAFRSFSDAYYRRYAKDYKNHYNPQLDEQYQETAGTLDARMGDRGLGESTVALHEQAKLSEQHTDERTNIANAAVDAANALRGNVERTKSDLYSLNEASADPRGINARAVGQASSLVAPQSYGSLGQVFASALEPWTYYAQSARNTPGQRYSSPYSVASGQGSGRVVS